MPDVGPALFLQEDESADAEGLSDKPEDYSSDEDPANPTSPSKAHAVLPPGVNVPPAAAVDS